MKSKKNKENTTPPRTLEKDSNHRNAFSFLKNRFFSGNNNNSNSSNNTIVNNNNSSNSTLHEKLSSPRPSISSIRSVVTKPWSIETKNETITDKPLSRSFDDNSSTDITTTYHRNRTNARPLSMMGIDSLSTELPATIHIAKPSVAPDTLSKDNDEAEKRTSLTIAKEGYLFKKSDFKPFHKQSKLDRGWKLYRVVLRGHKLYLYKLTTESPLRSLFPSAPHNKLQHSNQSIASLHSLSSSSIVSNNNMKLVRSDFDREAQQVLFSSTTTTTIPQGCVFMELNQSTLLAKQETYLILLDDMVYICIRPDLGQLWKIENKVSAQNLRIETSDSIPPTSPASISSMQSDPFSYSLLFSLINLNLPSAPLGVYSTQHRELGQAWINAFQSLHQLQEDEILSTSSNQISGRMYNATQEDRHNLIYRNHRSDEIQGGTIHALVRQLFSEYATTITPTSSSSYLNVFLLTYSIFTSGANVLNEIKLILKEEREEKDRVLFQLRVLDIFTIWCQQFALDVMGDVATGMIDILENCMDNAASQVKELVLETLAENTKRTCEQVIVTTMTTTQPLGREEDEEDKEQNKNEVENISAYEVDGKRRDSINLSNLLITGLTQDVFLEMDPMSFAQQIYLFHLLKYKQFRDELLNPLSYLPRPQTSVLIDSQSSNNNKYGISMRSRLLEHWIRIGLSLLQLGDMTGWCAVAMGVCSVGIVRLHETWKGVSRELVYHVQTDWVRLLSDFGLFTQDVWNETWGEPPMLTQFSRVLDMHDIAATHDVSPSLAEMYIPEGSLPFFGTIRQSVDRFKKHTKSF
ncbi:MAG: ras guanine nucleotide exchange factor domain-containing protein [Benjaminiella poitrasii]|nr:MAG: ras guanine nucleotide exchange factor domain-containing protein [Benjaminiella poitrasii]